MKKIIVDKLPRIIKNRKKLEKKLQVKITHRGKEVYIEGEPEDEYIAEKTIDALDFGFPFSAAIGIKEQNFEFEVINIKEHTKRKDLERIRGRIIGTKGKTLQTLSQLTNCNLELKDNRVGIIGEPEYLKNAGDAIVLLIKGTKQGNAYQFLEKRQPKSIGDLGLKE